MHFIPSVARTAATKIAQTAKAGKAKIFLRSCAALCLLLLCVWGVSEAVYKVTAGGWGGGPPRVEGGRLRSGARGVVARRVGAALRYPSRAALLLEDTRA